MAGNVEVDFASSLQKMAPAQEETKRIVEDGIV